MKTTVKLNTLRALKWNLEKGEWDTEPVHGTVRIEIDVEKIIDQLGRKALLNKTGRAIEYNGLLKATRL